MESSEQQGSNPPDGVPPLSDSQFVELLTKSQVRLRGYVMSLVRKPNDAEDVLQNACTTLWLKRHGYDPEREFFRWACGVCLIEVLRYRRKIATDRLMFDETLINTLASEYLENATDRDLHSDLLPKCVSKLSQRDRTLIETRYRSGLPVAEIAKQSERPLSTVYSALARIREALHRCLQASIAQQSQA